MFMCSKCGETNWKREEEKIVVKSKNWPIALKIDLQRFECRNCGELFYSADLDSDSLFPNEVVT